MIGRAALFLTLVLSLADGCQKVQGGNNADGRKPVPPFNSGPVTSLCVIDSFAVIAANNPHQSKNTPSDMVGKARVTCSQRVDRIVLEVKIQHQLTDGTWSDYTKVFGLDDPIVAVEPGKPYTRQAVTRCPKGFPDSKFRTAARASGTLNGAPAGTTLWRTSGEVTVPCK